MYKPGDARMASNDQKPGRGLGSDSFSEPLRGNEAYWALILDSGFRNCERIDVSWFKAPSDNLL